MAASWARGAWARLGRGWLRPAARLFSADGAAGAAASAATAGAQQQRTGSFIHVTMGRESKRARA
jgi:hypothetical protein